MWKVSHFSLLKTKGSASFSLALRSVSDSRRLKVKFAVGSIYGKKAKHFQSSHIWTLILTFCEYIKCVILHLLLIKVCLLGSKLGSPALYHDCKILFDTENLFLGYPKIKSNYQEKLAFICNRHKILHSPPKGNTYILHNFPRFWALCYPCHCFVSLHTRGYSDNRGSQVTYTSHSTPVMHICMEQADNSSHCSS